MFLFTVRFRDEEERTIKTENGLLAADGYESAVRKILSYYEKDNVYAFSIEECDTTIFTGDYLKTVITFLNEKVKV